MSEQRLIDANELPVSSIDAVDVAKYNAKYGTGIPVVLLSDIEHALTIEPEHKTGKWQFPYEATRLVGICSQCGSHGNPKSNFCPNCGARMQEGEDNGTAD